jgi:hypothetical protein
MEKAEEEPNKKANAQRQKISPLIRHQHGGSTCEDLRLLIGVTVAGQMRHSCTSPLAREPASRRLNDNTTKYMFIGTGPTGSSFHDT